MAEARSTDLARQAEMFCEASIRDWTGRAARMLAANPELAGYNVATAVVLGDADRVRAEIARDPGLATRVDARTGWTARPTRRSSRCCWSAARCPTTTTCTWPGSAATITRACG
jgi:hypothetical protein